MGIDIAIIKPFLLEKKHHKDIDSDLIEKHEKMKLIIIIW